MTREMNVLEAAAAKAEEEEKFQIERETKRQAELRFEELKRLMDEVRGYGFYHSQSTQMAPGCTV